MIRLIHLTKQYGKFTAVDDIDLVVPSGELFGFLGPNGAGKTTTFRMIAGILRPTSGTVEIGGIDINRNPLDAKARLGRLVDWGRRGAGANDRCRAEVGLWRSRWKDVDLKVGCSVKDIDRPDPRTRCGGHRLGDPLGIEG